MIDDDESTGNEMCDALGHDDEVVDEDEEGYTWRCLRCGAEGWEEVDDEVAEHD